MVAALEQIVATRVTGEALLGAGGCCACDCIAAAVEVQIRVGGLGDGLVHLVAAGADLAGGEEARQVAAVVLDLLLVTAGAEADLPLAVQRGRMGDELCGVVFVGGVGVAGTVTGLALLQARVLKDRGVVAFPDRSFLDLVTDHALRHADVLAVAWERRGLLLLVPGSGQRHE
ncbi:MAG: hypothetical protein ACYS5W_20665 [Planctomycetota bacterium]